MCTMDVMILEVLHAENQQWIEKEPICHRPEPTHPGSGATYHGRPTIAPYILAGWWLCDPASIVRIWIN